MKFYRIWALIERDMRKFFRSPALMMASMVFPLVQLIVLGYAFGGKIKGATIAFVDKDHSVESRKVRENSRGSRPARKRFAWRTTSSVPRAVDDLKAGFVRGVIEVPHDFSRRLLPARPAADRLHRRQHRPGDGQRAAGARAADGRRN